MCNTGDAPRRPRTPRLRQHVRLPHCNVDFLLNAPCLRKGNIGSWQSLDESAKSGSCLTTLQTWRDVQKSAYGERRVQPTKLPVGPDALDCGAENISRATVWCCRANT